VSPAAARDDASSDEDQAKMLTDLLDTKLRALAEMARELDTHRDLAADTKVRLKVALLEADCVRINRRLALLGRPQQ
jgi:hypothetical protein